METIKTLTPTDEAISEARAHVAYIGRLLFERRLTDAAGGNISVRVGNRLCMSPRYSGTKRQWQLTADDVLVTDLDRNILLGAGQLTREANVHYKLHNEFGDYGTAIIHAHARNLLVFATTLQPVPPTLEATRKFGVTPVIDYAPAHHMQLAENVAASLRGRESRIQTHAAGVLAPWHGLFLMGKDLDAAFDAVERLDTNAYILMMGRLLVGETALNATLQQMEDIIGNYQDSAGQ